MELPGPDAVALATVLVKHENVQPTGAFKVRGGLALFAGLPESERRHGIVTYSTGNHAQSVAYAAARVGARCVIAMPKGTSAAKVRATQALGGEVELVGASMTQAQQRAEQLAAQQGLRLVSPGDEPALIAGVGTLYRELFTAAGHLDAVVCRPVAAPVRQRPAWSQRRWPHRPTSSPCSPPPPQPRTTPGAPARCLRGRT